MAMLRYGAATLVKAGLSAKDWTDQAYKNACSNGRCQMKTARTVLAQYDPKKYLLSHCTIIAAVDTDLADPKNPKSDYLIKPEFSQFVNNNGDAWTKKMLQACYKTFVGANNYLEHVQIEELSKGKVIDAVLRDIPVGRDKTGNEVSTYYVDILVATDRKHKDLVRKIESRELDTLSMGCVIKYSICSKCGHQAVDESEACVHVRYEKGNMFFDDNGNQRKIAELCGHHTEPDSVSFVDASWVATPAFTGAVMRDVVTIPTDIMAKLEKAHEATTYKVKEGDFMKAASHLIAQEEDAPAEEEAAPAEEAPAEEPAEDAPADAPEQIPEEGMPPEEDTQFGEDDIRQWKNKIKNRILEELGQEIADSLTEEERPQELETLDESIIKPASVLKKVWGAKKSWDMYLRTVVGNLNKKDFDKLRYGTHMLMTSKDPTVLAEYGYKKRDFLAVLSFLDRCFERPMPVDIKRTVAKLGGTGGKQPIELLETIVSSLGRKITQREAMRSLTWLRLLDYYGS